MQTYAKVQDRESDRDTANLFTASFTKALSVPPLFDAIMAYSSLRLSLTSPSLVHTPDAAADRAARARVSLQSAMSSSATETRDEIEGLLAAIFIMVKREHMLAATESLSHIQYLLEIARCIVIAPSAGPLLADTHEIQGGSGFTRRIIARLAYHDCRASVFRMGGGGFVSALKSLPSLESFWETVDREAPGGRWGLLRANLLRLDVSQMDERVQAMLSGRIGDNCRPVDRVETRNLRREVESVITEWEQDQDATSERRTSSIGRRVLLTGEEDSQISASTYNRYIVIAALHSVLLYLDRVFVCSSLRVLSLR